MGEGQTFLATESSVLTQLIIRGLMQEFLGQKEWTWPSDTQLSPRELLKALGREGRVLSSGHHSVFWVWVGTAFSLPWEAKAEEQISAAVVTDSLCQTDTA